jgi:hypothetical protein
LKKIKIVWTFFNHDKFEILKWIKWIMTLQRLQPSTNKWFQKQQSKWTRPWITQATKKIEILIIKQSNQQVKKRKYWKRTSES